MNTSVAVLVATAIMGSLLFASVYIGLHYSKKSAKKLKESREKELNSKDK